ncbi:hypothetical protein [Jeotgalibaca porci]|uniref:hypothetical protein n=1 Tax=Jeotgalibaca porci TaxID=1868793 RepID=UPI00359F44C6
MENSNRSDIQKFFIDMKADEQNKAIYYLQKIIKKPPDCNPYQKSVDIMRDDIREFEERKRLIDD